MNKPVINVPLFQHTAKRAVEILLLVSAILLSNFALAGGGLDEATQQANTIKTWAYGFLGVGVFLYMIYNVIMALLNKQPWSDVLMAMVYVTIAGAVIVLTTWAWGVWGS